MIPFRSRIPVSVGLAVCLATLVAIHLACARALTADEPAASPEEVSLPVTTSVKSIARASRPSPDAGMPDLMQRPAAPATLPAERFPQYRTGYHRAEGFSSATDRSGEIRFLLNDPSLVERVGRPLLITVTAFLDGKPFTERFQDKSKALVALPLSDPATDSGSGSPENSDAPESNPLSDTPEADPPEASSPPDPAEQTEPESDAAASPSEQDASEQDAGSDDASADDPPEESPTTEPPTQPPYQLASSAEETMRRYRAAVGEDVTAAEAEWMLTHWVDGPSLLVLHPYFQGFRADQRPAFRVLDRDGDGTVSKEELATAKETLQQCDANRDDVVDVLEISRSPAATSGQDVPPPPQPVLILVSELQSIINGQIEQFEPWRSFDSDGNENIDADELETLASRRPDIELAVRFDTQENGHSKLRLTAVAAELRPALQVTTQAGEIELRWPGATLNFAAVQGAASDQISVGAVIDGYPLLPALDPNGDGRLTIRELRQLDQSLNRFDSDQDGQLTAAETRPPVRVCFGLGGTVHRELAGIRTTPPGEVAPIVTGPEWFVRMDRNHDNDLTRREFPGTAEQFDSLDADGDSLVSAAEANTFDAKSKNAE
ncbi:hypothetical protein FYK55_25655 [Roseiconus nitratireducens]|uniref:EF-hand domain-containing protein n=1 Tax=Roseiconus nitratireducens TaxID=2605748 RepID=A0A5M6CUR2_9BACT|nr:EF-hand domain-containing protein [Roseiconus nitratireducens]KAA5538987.1 hypothetical protein FYK55_25655 [Roseiconus nitratireducens]